MNKTPIDVIGANKEGGSGSFSNYMEKLTIESGDDKSKLQLRDIAALKE